ncbi:hypothetical protein R3P38DRAFT_2543418, partial [Favolaschia claudopus]
YLGPFALQTLFKQMGEATFYSASALQLPAGTRTWSLRNNFQNDNAYIGTRFLLRLVQNQGLVPTHVLKITHLRTEAAHIVVLLPDGRYMCDCCMG